MLVLGSFGGPIAADAKSFFSKAAAAPHVARRAGLYAAAAIALGFAPTGHPAEFQRVGGGNSTLLEIVQEQGAPPAFRLARDGRPLMPAGYSSVTNYLDRNPGVPTEVRALVNANWRRNLEEFASSLDSYTSRGSVAGSVVGPVLSTAQLLQLQWPRGASEMYNGDVVLPGVRAMLPRVQDANDRGSIVVDVAASRLYVVGKGGAVEGFLVGLGGPKSPTGEGRYWLDKRRDNPTWTLAPNGQLAKILADERRMPARTVVPGGHPDNPLSNKAYNLLNSSGKDTLLRVHGPTMSVLNQAKEGEHAVRQKLAGLGMFSVEAPESADAGASASVQQVGTTGGCIRMMPQDLERFGDAVAALEAEPGRSPRGKHGTGIPVYVTNAPVKVEWVQPGTNSSEMAGLFLQVDVVPAGYAPPDLAKELDRIKATADAHGLDWNKIAAQVREVLDRPTGVPTRITEGR